MATETRLPLLWRALGLDGADQELAQTMNGHFPAWLAFIGEELNSSVEWKQGNTPTRVREKAPAFGGAFLCALS